MAAKSFYIAKRIKNKSERWNKSEEMQSDDMSDYKGCKFMSNLIYTYIFFLECHVTEM